MSFSQNQWYIYILLCKDGSLYTGATNNLGKRFAAHVSGRGGKYTRSHLPIKILYSEEFATQSEALKREAEIKRWSRQKKISQLHLENILTVQYPNGEVSQ
jgi:putative endonuclease